ncbi:unnamed protein product [Urochloa humidicola]
MLSFPSPAIPLTVLLIATLHVAGIHAQIPASATTGAAVAATNPQPGSGGGGVSGGPDAPLELYMHDILGGSSPTARPITGLLGNIYNGQVPFARPIGFSAPRNGVAIPNANGQVPTVNGNNGIPLDTGLSGAGFLQPGNGGGTAAAAPAQVQLGPDGLSLGFGTITVIDDVLTSGPDLGAPPLGRAQGVYVASSADGSSQMMAFTAMMEGGEYGDTVNFFGVYKVGTPLCRLSITGGTGKFKGACGFAEVRPLIASGQHVTDGAETLLRITVHLA